MSILDVIDRVIIAPGLGNFEIEIERAIRAAGEENKASCVFSDFIDYFAQCDELTSARAHCHRLARPQQIYQLNEDNPKVLFGSTDRLNASEHPLDISMVIGTPYIYNRFETAFEFVQVVCKVRGKIGAGAICADDNPVLLVAECCAPEPDGPFVVVDESARS